jgi:hypothetical protein
VYEGFNGYTNGAAMHNTNVSANAIGLTGTYQGMSGTTGGESFIKASSNQLTYSTSFAKTGGSLVSSSNNSSAIGVSLGSVGTVTGTIYMAYLFMKSTNNNGFGQVRLNDNPTDNNTTQYFFSGAHTGSALGVSYNSDATAPAGSLTTQLQGGANAYLIISEFTEVDNDPLTGSGTATTWVLTIAQYDYFKTDGFTRAELASASIGSAANQVARTATETATFLGNSFAPGDALQINITSSTGTGSNIYAIDELRIGTDLMDVMGLIPEPGSAALVITALAAASLTRRRRSE